ncbi:MAG: hypothetical protein ABI873_05775 [Marmoricola sp.]
MRRAQLGTSAGAVAALALSSLTVAGTVQAAGSADTSGASRADKQTKHRADPAFGPAQRRAAIAGARSEQAKTGRALRLGDKQALVVKNVQRDVDGIEHVR